MDKEQAYKIGLAFKLGIIYARGKAHARQLANDDAKWITVHPKGKENNGRPALLDSETGEVLGGMGGKFNGKHISAVPQHGKNEQMGAQMRVNAKNHKADLMNGQKIDFIKNNPDIQKNLEETKKADEQRKNNQPAENQIANTTNTYINNIQNEINKAKGNNETLPKFKTHVTVLKVLENLPDGSIIHSQKGGFLRKEKDGSFSALNDQGELVSKNMPLKIDDLYDSSNNWSIGIGKTTEEAQKNTTTFRLDNISDIGKSKRVEEQKQQARQDYFKKYENSFKDSDGHTTAGLNDIDFDKAVKAFNNSSQDPERRARVLRQDYVSSVNNMYDDLKGRIENKEQQEYLNKEFEKGKQQILKAYNDYLSSESQTASTSAVGKMRSALQARKMNEKQDRAFEKRANIANIVEKIQEKIGDGLWERNNKNLERRNNATKTRTQNKQESITNADFKKYHMPLNHLSKIEKETDKAFLISSNFASGFDGDDIEYQKRSVWVPKSQVSSKNGYVFGMNPKYAKENGFTTQRSRELAKRLRLPQNNTTTANKTLSANKDNGSVASVLNVPDASKWNNKIYSYRNGEKAVFINNQKIVLNDEQYKKLKELAGK